MAVANPTPAFRIRKKLRCADCGRQMRWYGSEPYCVDCTAFTLPPPRPTVEVGIAFEAAGDLLQMLAGAGWDVEVRGDSAALYHLWVRTAGEARRLLARQGFSLGLFDISE